MKTTPVRSDQELIRQFAQRIKALENRNSVRVGPWSIVSRNGQLLAVKPGEETDIGVPGAPEEVNLGPDRGVEFDIPAAVDQALTNAINGGGVLTPDSELLASNIIGTAPPGLIDVVPISAIGETPQQLLANPLFAGETSIIEGFGWTHDATTWYGDFEDAGSAKVVADGTQHELYSNPGRIVPGQEVPASIHVKWEDLVATGNPIKLKVIGYKVKVNDPRKLEVVETQVVAEVITPTGDSDWVLLSGTYTPGVDVTHVAMGLFLGDTASTGSVWWSVGSLDREAVPVPQSAIDQLPEDLQAQEDFTQAVVDNTVLAVEGTVPPGGATTTDLHDTIENFFLGTEDTAAQSADNTINQQDTWNRFLRWLTGDSGATGATPDDVETYLVTVGEQVQTAQESAITLANLANAPKNVPFWVSPNPFEDVAFPRSSLFEVGGDDVSGGTASTDPPNTGGHTHGSGSLIFNLLNVTPLLTLAAGTMAMITIRTTADRIYNSVGFITDGATPPSTVYCGLFKIDPTNGTMSIEYNFGNVSSSILTGTVSDGVGYDTRFNTTSDIQANAGDLWAVGILPIGASLKIGAIRKTTLTITGVYPRYATSTLAGQSSLPSTVTDGSQADATRRGWACLGQALPEDTSPLTIVETFNVGDTDTWTSSSWNVFNHPVVGGSGPSKIGIASGMAYEASPFSGSLGWMSSRLAKTVLHNDDHAAEITLGNGWATSSYGNATDRAYVRCRNNGTAGVVMHVDSPDNANVRIRIANITSMNSIGTVRATNSGTVPYTPGDKFKIEAVGNVFTCYRKGASDTVWTAVAGATWTDSGAITAIGKNFRSVGFGTGAYRDGLSGQHPCAYIDYFSGYDLAA